MNQKLIETKKTLDGISSTMCLAKWNQPTVYLNMGKTHSCHHPNKHTISIANLKSNPSSLINTPIIIRERKDLLNGIQTKECNYCWKIENTTDSISDRIYKSAEFLDSIPKILENPEDFTPKYLEVIFDNICSFRCSYCSPECSSRIMDETQRKGPIVLPSGYQTISVEQLKQNGTYNNLINPDNVYVQAFWDWFPELYSTLETLRISGGEPLLSKQFWKLLDYVIDNPRKENPIKLAVNSNLGVPDDLIDKLITKIKVLESIGVQFDVFTSAETTGDHQEYIRDGMVWNEFDKNVKKILEQTNSGLIVSTTMCNLSILRLQEFIDWYTSLKLIHNRLRISFNYIRHPPYMQMQVLPESVKKYITDWWNENAKDYEHIFRNNEIDKLNQCIEIMNQTLPNHNLMWNDLLAFFKEFDTRRKLDSSIFGNYLGF